MTIGQRKGASKKLIFLVSTGPSHKPNSGNRGKTSSAHGVCDKQSADRHTRSGEQLLSCSQASSALTLAKRPGTGLTGGMSHLTIPCPHVSEQVTNAAAAASSCPAFGRPPFKHRHAVLQPRHQRLGLQDGADVLFGLACQSCDLAVSTSASSKLFLAIAKN